MTICHMYPYNTGKRTKGNTSRHHFYHGSHMVRLSIADRLGFAGLSLDDHNKVAVLKPQPERTQS